MHPQAVDFGVGLVKPAQQVNTNADDTGSKPADAVTVREHRPGLAEVVLNNSNSGKFDHDESQGEYTHETERGSFKNPESFRTPVNLDHEQKTGCSSYGQRHNCAHSQGLENPVPSSFLGAIAKDGHDMVA